MIEKDVIGGGRLYICDDCSISKRFSSYDTARLSRWAISATRQKCYCPTCAEAHRHVGRNGYKNY